MRKWFNKIAAIFTALMMFGFYVPPTSMNPEANAEKDSNFSTPTLNENELTNIIEDSTETYEVNEASPTDVLINKAREMTLYKLGPKITSKVEDDLLIEVLPQMEKVVEEILLETDEDLIPYFEITENPSTGEGERIFNLYNNLTNGEVAMFHVRRDKKPLEGYWFNFHYHLNDDGFETHHPISEVYWDKNTPPNWMVH